MTTYSAADSHTRALANQPVPLTPSEVLDKYSVIFEKIWAAAGNGLFYLNIQLLDTQFEEFSPVVQDQGYGISLALPTSVETYATNSTGITVTGSISDGASGSGNILIVTEAADLGLSAGIPITGAGIDPGTYITSITPSYSRNITGGTKQNKTFGATATNNSYILTSVDNFDNVAVGAQLSGTNILVGAIISDFNVDAGTITMSLRANGTGPTTVTFPIFTIQTATSGGYAKGMTVVVAGQPDGHYNRSWVVSGVSGGTSATQFQVTPDNTWTAPLAPTAVGTVTPTGTSGGVGYYEVNNSQSVSSGDISSYWFTVGNSQGMVPNGKITFTGTQVSTRAYETFTNGNIAVDSTDGLYAGMSLRFIGSSLGGIAPYKVYYVVTASGGILTVSNDNASGSVETWTDDATTTMSVQAGGVFGGVTSGQTYYIHSVPDAYHVVISQTVGGNAIDTPSEIGYMTVVGDTTASNLVPAVPVYTGPASIGTTGNNYIISW
jgi:hypothetical protein